MHRAVLVSVLAAAASVAHADAPRRGASVARPRHVAAPAAPSEDDALGAVAFGRGSTRLVGNAHEQARRIADWQRRHPDSVLIIDARTLREGTRPRSLRLSQARTDAVRTELLRYGADPTRMMLLARTDDPGSSARGAQGRVVIRATNFTGPAPVADVAARGTSTDRRSGSAPRGRALGDSQAPASSTTVVIVPGGGAGGGPVVVQNGNIGSQSDGAGGAGRTSGGTGTSAQTGLGFDPTDTDTIGAGTGTGVIAGNNGAANPSGSTTGSAGTASAASSTPGVASTSGVGTPVGAGVTGSGIGPNGTGNGPRTTATGASGGGSTGTGTGR